MGYDPYFENSPVLDAFLESYYQYHMVVLGWMVDLVSISTNTEVKKLVYQFDMPREGHVGDVLHVYAYLTKCNSRFAFGSNYPDTSQDYFTKCDCKYFYGGVKEYIFPNAPDRRFKEVDLCMYVKSYRGYKLKRKSRTVFIIFIINALIKWFP